MFMKFTPSGSLAIPIFTALAELRIYQYYQPVDPSRYPTVAFRLDLINTNDIPAFANAKIVARWQKQRTGVMRIPGV